MSCPLCTPPTVTGSNAISVVFTPADLCSEHLEMSGIPSFEQSHPMVGDERPCHPTCGCVPLSTLTYLARGIQYPDR